MGIHGTPQLRRSERRRYLGFFRERVIQAVTFSQIRTREGIAAINQALEDKRARELVVHSNARARAMPSIMMAQNRGIDFTITNDPEFMGEVAVIVVAPDAVDIEKFLSDSEIKSK